MSGTRKDVLTVNERNGRSFWTKIGSAWVRDNGTIGVQLDALPVNGKLEIRDPYDRQKQLPLGKGAEPPEGFEEKKPLDEDDIPF